jgi:hypothetical protein
MTGTLVLYYLPQLLAAYSPHLRHHCLLAGRTCIWCGSRSIGSWEWCSRYASRHHVQSCPFPAGDHATEQRADLVIGRKAICCFGFVRARRCGAVAGALPSALRLSVSLVCL